MPPSTGNYKYASDLGVRSIEGLVELARSSGINIRVGSSYRPGDPGWHGQQNAVDLFGSVSDMTRLAAYLVQYAVYLGELLFTPPTAYVLDNGRVAGGYYVDNGVRLSSASRSVAEEHRDHVHLAATVSGLMAAAAQTPGLLRKWQREQKKAASQGQVPGAGSVVDPVYGTGTGSRDDRPGCLKKTAAAAIIIATPVTGIAYGLHTLLGG